MVSKLRVNEIETLDGNHSSTIASLVEAKEAYNERVPYVIAVVGDSLSTTNNAHEVSWVTYFKNHLEESGLNVRVVNFSQNSFTFNRANTYVDYAGDTKTAREAIADLDPDLVITGFGTVDAYANEESRTLTQLNADADSFFSYIKSNTTSASIVHAKFIQYDRVNGSEFSLRNKDVIPYFFNRRTGGLLANAFSKEILGDSIISGDQANFNLAGDFFDDIENNANVDGTIDVDYWRIARLGLLGTDSLHPKSFGKMLTAAYVFKGLDSIPPFSEVFPRKYPVWYDPDLMFEDLLDQNNNWAYTPSGGSAHAVNLSDLGSDIAPDSWFLPYKTSFIVSERDYPSNEPFIITVLNGKPNAVVLPSIDGGNFDAGSPTATLDDRGFGQNSAVNVMSEGTYEFRYKVGEEVHGPYTLTFSERSDLEVKDGGTGASTATNARTNLGLDLDGPHVPNLTNGWTAGDPDYSDLRYWKDHTGRVYLEGNLKGGNSSIAFTLPSGFTPHKTKGFVVAVAGEPQVILIYSDGRVDLPGYTLGSTDLAFLDNVSFMT